MSFLEHDWFPRPVPDDVVVGERTWLYSAYAFHHSRGAVRIGADCGIYHGTHFELGPGGEVEIGDFCTIVGAVIATNGPLWIGDHTFVAHEVTIAASEFAVPPRGGSLEARRRQVRGQHPAEEGGDRAGPLGATPDAPDAPIAIGSGAWIGARAVILAGARVGRDAVVGAGAVIAGEVPPGATAVGNPARIVGA